MGSLILCHARKARQPYEIARVHKKIFTIEELCYYIYHHLYLVDYTFASHQLCDWIDEELELSDMADDLRDILNNSGSTEDFILRILGGASIYSQEELRSVEEKLFDFYDQKDVQKEKFKADQLLRNGEFESAVFIYQRIVTQEWDESVDEAFYGRIYASLGAAYGRMLLYSHAASMYEKACQYLEDSDVRKAYIYACYQAYPQELYEQILNRSACEDLDLFVKARIEEAKKGLVIRNPQTQIQDWKNNHRGFRKI